MSAVWWIQVGNKVCSHCRPLVVHEKRPHGKGKPCVEQEDFVQPNCVPPKSSHQIMGTSRSLLLSSLHLPLSCNHPRAGSDGGLIISDVNDKPDDKSWDLMGSLNPSQPASKICFVKLPSGQNNDKTLSHSCSGYFFTCRKCDFGRAYFALHIAYGAPCSASKALRPLPLPVNSAMGAQELLVWAQNVIWPSRCHLGGTRKRRCWRNIAWSSAPALTKIHPSPPPGYF